MEECCPTENDWQIDPVCGRLVLAQAISRSSLLSLSPMLFSRWYWPRSLSYIGILATLQYRIRIVVLNIIWPQMQSFVYGCNWIGSHYCIWIRSAPIPLDDLHYSNTWASYQIHKIVGCACAGNAGNVLPVSAIPTCIMACRDACRDR